MPLCSFPPTEHTPLIIGTRGSPLALAQANSVVHALCQAHSIAASACVVRPITTRGDQHTHGSFAQLGGKATGLFTRELDQALLFEHIDIAVHSAKDLPSNVPNGIVCHHYLPRADTRDAFVSYRAKTINDLPQGAVVGSSSIRRRAQIMRARSDLRVIEFRGNINTRLQKLQNGQADATLLALAGLLRLNMGKHTPHTPIPVDMALPALAQGAIAVSYAAKNGQCADFLHAINHPPTQHALMCERACLQALQADCNVPLAGLAKIQANQLVFNTELLHPVDGHTITQVHMQGDCQNAVDIGYVAGQRMRTAARAEGLLQSNRWCI